MTEPSLIESDADEPTSGPASDHPPFKLRDRRLVLLPDLRPPSLDELRWSARERRRRREGHAPQQRRPISHDQLPAREPADVPTSLVEESLPELEQPAIVLPDVAPAEDFTAPPVEGEAADDSDFFDLYDPEFPDLTPWRPVVPPDAEPEAEAEPEADAEGLPEADELPPLVSQVLVVHEPVPSGPGRIAVLDEVETAAPIITRLVPLSAEPIDDIAVEAPAFEEIYPEDVEELEELEAEQEASGRTAPLYWRLLRLRYTRPNGWLRALYFEGAVALGVVLVLAEAASVWTIVVLPLIVAVVVKANDVLAGNLRSAYRQPKRRPRS